MQRAVSGWTGALNDRDWGEVCRRSVQGDNTDCREVVASELGSLAGRVVVRSASMRAGARIAPFIKPLRLVRHGNRVLVEIDLSALPGVGPICYAPVTDTTPCTPEKAAQSQAR